ncbi:MAG: hypothetical protein JSU73_08940 [candidate division WOR-3 bacterium]|nr:MAG: hypothetical protein JSU73_08940 [candidate division WOR-3 bacterium]
MKALQYSVVVLPKLDNEAEIQRLREKYDPGFYQIRPHIPIILPFTPATIDELQGISDYISVSRRKLHARAISFHECIESGDRLFFVVDQGKGDIMALHHALQGCEVTSLVSEGDYEPRLMLGRIPDPEQRGLALREAQTIGRTLGIVDSVSMLRISPHGELKLVANYPFGIGRVDHFHHLRA